MPVSFRIYLISDRAKVPEGMLVESIERALRAGVGAVQLREKDLDTRAVALYAGRLREVTRHYGAAFFINDRVDVALAVGADGVHLGYQSMPIEAVRRIVGGRLLIGVSTHGLREAVDAERQGADFITFGPVFHTASKAAFGEPLGIKRLAEVSGALHVPVYAIGGIDAGNIPSVMECGIQGVALISAVLGAQDIESKTSEIVRLIK